jgi:hypothetical protein
LVADKAEHEKCVQDGGALEATSDFFTVSRRVSKDVVQAHDSWAARQRGTDFASHPRSPPKSAFPRRIRRLQPGQGGPHMDNRTRGDYAVISRITVWAAGLASRLPWGAVLRSAALVGGLAILAPSQATTVNFTLPASLSGASGRLDFSLFDGDSDLGNNTVTISNLTTNGTLQGADCSVGCTGGPPFVLDDSLGFGQLLQDLLLGTSLSFDLTFTTTFSGSGVPDRLILNLLDPDSNLTLVTTDLNKDVDDPVGYHEALLVLDLKDGGLTVATTISDVVQPTVPEPSTITAVLAGLALLRLARRRAAVSGPR